MDKFTLTIALGNEAMQTPEDVADALRRVAGRLQNYGTWPADADWPIWDLNGNTVGHWEAA